MTPRSTRRGNSVPFLSSPDTPDCQSSKSMASSTSTSGTNLPTATEGDDDLAALLAEQHEELMAAKTAHSDLEFAFQLQMKEAMAASVLLSPTFSTVATSSDDGAGSSSPLNDDFAAAADLFAEEMERLEREQANLLYLKAEMRRMREDLDLQLHDRKVASEISAIPEQEWQATGNYYEKPYTQMAICSTSTYPTTIGGRGYFSLYFKGLVVMDQSGVRLGAIGVSIFDSTSVVVLEVSKPLILADAVMRDEVAQLEAFVHGLDIALSLDLRRVVYSCVDFNIDNYLNGNHKPMEGKVAELVDRAVLLQKRFLDCKLSRGSMNNAQRVLDLARSSIANQAGKPVKESILRQEKCPICLEDVDSGKMFEIGCCCHRFCSSCMQKHVELKVLSRELPRCPQPNCGLEINFSVCREFLNPKIYDIMDQLVKESSIPTTKKVYCPNPRCSNLMSITDALTNTRSVAGSSNFQLTPGRCEKCHILFCINCKVLWHSNMSCDDFKKRKPDSSSMDAKLKLLAGNKKWRQCQRCSHMVELAHGCNHIYCRCGHQFCYLCGCEWKDKRATCSCPLWSEENIISHGGAQGQ